MRSDKRFLFGGDGGVTSGKDGRTARISREEGVSLTAGLILTQLGEKFRARQSNSLPNVMVRKRRKEKQRGLMRKRERGDRRK